MTPERQATGQPTPALLFDTINAHQRTEAIKTAIELSLFTAIAEGKTTAREIAQSCGASERGTRILCDYLVIMGFLTKENGKPQGNQHRHFCSTPSMLINERKQSRRP